MRSVIPSRIRRPVCSKCQTFRVTTRKDTLCRVCGARQESLVRRLEGWQLVKLEVAARGLGIHAQAYVYDVLSGFEPVDEILSTIAQARALQAAGVFDLLPYVFTPVRAKDLTSEDRYEQFLWFPQRGWAESPQRAPLPEQSRTTRVTLVSFTVKEPGSYAATDPAWAKQYPQGTVLIQGRPWTGKLHTTLYAIPGDWEIYRKEQRA